MWGPGRDRRDNVSILVVMERTHRQRRPPGKHQDSRCFNPCCDGTDSSTSAAEARDRADPASFNPCCDGTDSSTRNGTIILATLRGFNPCCDGTDSSTILLKKGFQPCVEVSILVVMERTHRPLSCLRGIQAMSVSILVVMERTHRPDLLCMHEDDDDAVSILVVMERTHRRATTNQGSPTSPSFNPCCDGTDSSTKHTVSHWGRLKRFQSLL